VDGVTYMPGVGIYGENGGKTLTNFRMYGSIPVGLPKGILPRFAECSRISKIGCYESPYAVTGGKAERLGTGLEEAPKGIKRIGLLERGKLRTQMQKRLQADVALIGKGEKQ
jgi:hypothetical protein